MGIVHRLLVMDDEGAAEPVGAVIIGTDHGQQVATLISSAAIHEECLSYDVIVDRQRTVLGRIRPEATGVFVTVGRLLIPRRRKLT